MDAPRDVATPSGVAWRLSRVGAEVSRRFAERVGPLGLTPSDAAALRAVGRGAASQAELAAHLGLAPSRMVAVVDSLERRELVDRVVDADDRRRRVVTLTPAGTRALERLREVAAAHDTDIVGDLGDDDLHELRRLLGDLEARLGIEGHRHPGMR